MLEFLRGNARECIAVVGAVCVGAGVGMHDTGAGLAVFGALIVGLVVYAVERG